MNDLSCGMRIWAQVSFVLSQSTRLSDGQTDGRALHYMQSRGKNTRTLSKIMLDIAAWVVCGAASIFARATPTQASYQHDKA